MLNFSCVQKCYEVSTVKVAYAGIGGGGGGGGGGGIEFLDVLRFYRNIYKF